MPAASSGGSSIVLRNLFTETPSTDPESSYSVERAIVARNQTDTATKTREPLYTACKAATQMAGIMQRAVNKAYCPVKTSEEQLEGPGYAVAASIALFGVPLLLGLQMVASLLWPLPILVAGAGVLHDELKAQLPRRFSAASKTLAAAARRLPEGPEKTLVLEFNGRAQALFALGHAAALQQRTAEGQGSRWRLRRLQRKGLALIDQAVTEMGWQDTERIVLRAAFQQGQFPKMDVFRNELDTQVRQFSDRMADLIVETNRAPPAIASPCDCFTIRMRGS